MAHRRLGVNLASPAHSLYLLTNTLHPHTHTLSHTSTHAQTRSAIHSACQWSRSSFAPPCQDDMFCQHTGLTASSPFTALTPPAVWQVAELCTYWSYITLHRQVMSSTETVRVQSLASLCCARMRGVSGRRLRGQLCKCTLPTGAWSG